MVAVGYMDPGNWATNIAGGSMFGYTLLFVILLSNLFAMLLQHLALRLGIASGLDLAQACRMYYSKPVNFVLWLLCEVAIIACDLAEVLGSALALKLLFGIPMHWGVLITVLDVLLLLLLQDKAFRILELIVAVLIGSILISFLVDVFLAKPAWNMVLKGLLPDVAILKNPQMLYVAIGILGATVMPHNLYLHSSIVKTRRIGPSEKEKREAITYASIDSTASLFIAFFINAFILILSASVFHFNGYKTIADIRDAHVLLGPVLGSGLAATLFALALLASGQNATLTGTLAGQIVMEGFLELRLKPWVRRLLTRSIAVIPAFIVTLVSKENATGQLLILSQVVLSMQLSFAVFPLVSFAGSRSKMNGMQAPLYLIIPAWIIAFIICGLNIYLLIQTFAA